MLRLDLGATVPIDCLRILTGPKKLIGTVTIEIADDAQTWTYFGVPDPGATEAGAWIGVARDAGLIDPVSARYVRIVCVISGDAKALGGVAEVEVLPPAGSEWAPKAMYG